MGLAIEINVLAWLSANDEEGAASFSDSLAAVNRALEEEGYAPFVEPRVRSRPSQALPRFR